MRTHPWRTLACALLALLLIVALAGILIVRSLLQPQRFTALLQSQLANADLTLSAGKPAAPALWPHPAVRLQGFSLSNAGAAMPLLTATQARIVVPWRALLHRELLIERIEIDSPRIDLEQLQALLARLPQNAGAPQLPHIGTGVRISDGTLVRGDTPLLLDINAETGPLLPQTPFRLDLSALDNTGSAGALSLRTTPMRKVDALTFEHTGIGIAIERSPATDATQMLRAQLSGNALWRGGAAITAELSGTLTTPVPRALTSNIAPPAAKSKTISASSTAKTAAALTASKPRIYAVTLAVQPARGFNPLTLGIKLDGADEHINAQVPPLALIDWWQRLIMLEPGATPTLPPLRGQAQISGIDIGDVHARDLRIEAGPDVMPLDAKDAASTKPGNASSAGH